MIEARLLGQFEILLDGSPLGIPSRPAQSLLGYLLLNPNVQHRREMLAGLFWPEVSEENARRSLRQALWQIRKAFEGAPQIYLQSDDISISFQLTQADWLDVRTLESSGDLMEAVSAYRGELLPGFYEDWASLERERLQGVFEHKLNQLVYQLVSQQRWEEVLVWGERWIAQGSAPEPAYRALMLAQHGLGNPSAMALAFQRCKDALLRELGIPPSEQTRQLYQRLLKEPAPAGTVHAPFPCEGGEQAPFKGLQFFEVEDAALFFGREDLTSQLVRRLEAAHDGVKLVAVVGPSGSGKSSLVRAGLIPILHALRQDHLADGGLPSLASERWDIRLLVPTAHPLEALAVSLTRESESARATAVLLDDLARDPRSLNLFLQKRFAGESRSRRTAESTLLIVDQFEELFTQCREEAERQSFIDNLLTAAAGEHARVLLTLRADFYAQCAQYASLRQALAANQEYIGPMSAAELRRAIEEPARAGRWEFEPGLVDLILRDIGASPGDLPLASAQVEPGALPLLSHALLETWQRREDCTLTLAGYNQAGGVRGSIARTAEGTYARLTEDEQRLARSIFLRLTELGDDSRVEFTPPDTRRRVSLDELMLSGENPEEIRRVLQMLTEARLVTAGEGVVEVAHEALIREWPALRGWLAEDREGLRLHRRLTEASQGWQGAGREMGDLYRGARLAQALEWTAAHPGELNALEQDFLDASRHLTRQDEAERELQRQRELEAARQLAEVESRRAGEQAAANRQLRWFASGLGILLLAALILGGFVLQQRNLAQEQSRLAASRELAASAISNLPVDPERSILLALQALTARDTREAEVALHQAVQGSRLRRSLTLQKQWGLRIVLSPDGSRFATTSGGPDHKLLTEVWDTLSGKRLLTLPGGLAGESWPANGRLATVDAGAEDTTLVRLWDAASGRLLTSTTLNYSFQKSVNGNIDPSWTHVVSAMADGTTLVSDMTTGKTLYTLGEAGSYSAANAVVFSPDGTRLVTSVGNITWMVDAATGQELFKLPSVDFGASALAFSPDGTRVAIGLGAQIQIADSAGGVELKTLSGPSGFINAIDFSADGTRIAAGASDGTAVIWNVASGQVQMILAGHAGAVGAVRFSPEGTRLVTAGVDQTARIWDVSPAGSREDLAWYDPQGAPFTGVSFSPDGQRLAASGGGSAGCVWDVSSGKTFFCIPGQGSYQGAVAFSPDGRELAITSGSELVDIWDSVTQQKKFTLYGHSHWVGALVFSPDGKRLATISFDSSASMWDPVSGKQLFSIQAFDENVDTQQVIGIAFSPDGRRFATAAGHTVRIWDAASGAQLLALPFQAVAVYTLAFTPDGKRLVTGLALGAGAIVWDASSGQKLFNLTGQRGSIQGIVFSRDGSQIITGSVDGSVKVWDAASGSELFTLTNQAAQITSLSRSPDGARLATASSDGTVRIYLLQVDELERLARARLTRGLTLDECQKYLHVSICPG